MSALALEDAGTAVMACSGPVPIFSRRLVTHKKMRHPRIKLSLTRGIFDVLVAEASGARRPDLKRPTLAVRSDLSAGVSRLYTCNIDS